MRRWGYVMRTKRCPACKGTGIGTIVRDGDSFQATACETCRGNGVLLWAEWTRKTTP